MNYDIFISYRREGGQDFANQVDLALKGQGFQSIFFDFNSLRNGVFDNQIIEAINGCKDFILILSEGSMDRCSNEDDWVAKEIRTAISAGCNIIPLVVGNFKDFPKDFPKDLKIMGMIQRSQLLRGEYFHDSIRHIVDRLKSESSITSTKLDNKIEEDYQLAKAYDESSKYDKAFEIFFRLANKGHIESIHELGEYYEYGCSVNKDIRKAHSWYAKAAEQGHLDSIKSLADLYDEDMYENNDNLDYEKAFFWLSKAAELDDAESLNRLGDYYRYGYYVDKDNNKALSFYSRANEILENDSDNYLYSLNMNDIANLYDEKKEYNQAFKYYLKSKEPDAYLYLGVYYRNGYGTKQNPQKAFEYISKGYEGKADYSNYWMGVLHRDGTGVKQDINKALNFFLEGANRGHVNSMYEAGCIYETNIKDSEKAYEMFSKASELNHLPSLNWLSYYYEEGGILEDPEELINTLNKMLCLNCNDDSLAIQTKNRLSIARRWQARCFFDNNEKEKALPIYKELANNGDDIAQIMYGHYYRCGFANIIKNEKIARDWYQKAANNGNAFAMNEIGELYYSKGDFKNAFKFFSKALEKDSDNTTFYLNTGICYLYGKGTNTDYSKSFNNFTKAYNKNDISACYWLGYSLYYGLGCNKNTKKAEDILIKGYKAGNISCANLLGDINYFENNYKQAVFYYEHAISKGTKDGNTYKNLGIILYLGYGVKEETDKAFNNLLQAYNYGAQEVEYWIGIAYLEGKGCLQDIKKSKSFFEKGAFKGDERCMLQLGHIAWDNENAKDAFNMYTKAISKGIKEAEAFLNVGICYRNGNGTSKNEFKAFPNFTSAYELGNFDAIWYLAEAYQYGLGCQTNREKAIELYKEGINKKDVDCMESLGELYYFEDNYDDALVYFEKAISSKSESSDIYEYAGVCYVHFKDRPNAFYCFNKSYELGNKEVCYWLGQVYEYAFGCNQDLVMAKKMYEEGALNNCSDSKNELDRFIREHKL